MKNEPDGPGETSTELKFGNTKLKLYTYHIGTFLSHASILTFNIRIFKNGAVFHIFAADPPNRDFVCSENLPKHRIIRAIESRNRNGYEKLGASSACRGRGAKHPPNSGIGVSKKIAEITIWYNEFFIIFRAEFEFELVRNQTSRYNVENRKNSKNVKNVAEKWSNRTWGEGGSWNRYSHKILQIPLNSLLKIIKFSGGPTSERALFQNQNPEKLGPAYCFGLVPLISLNVSPEESASHQIRVCRTT